MKVKRRSSRKGLSPVIATVLLILFVMVLASIIFLWARGFLSEQIEKFGQPIDKLCSGVNFEIANAGPSSGSRYSLEVVNRGEVDIYNLDIRLEKGGDTEVSKFNYNIPSGASIKGDALLKMGENKNVDPERVVAYPTLIGSANGGKANKVFTCLDQGKVVTL